MSGISDHFFEDSPVSRSAIGNVLFMCVSLSYGHAFVKNNTKSQSRKRDSEPMDASAAQELTSLLNNFHNTKIEECFNLFQPVLGKLCNSTETYDQVECDHFINNGMWDLCQALPDYEPCNIIEYEYSTDDYLHHPAFWAGCGFLIGLVLALIAILLIAFICSKCKKRKEKKNAKNGIPSGSGSASVENGKGTKSKVTSSDTKNSSDENNGKPAVPKSQYIGEQFPTADGKKSVFLGAQTIMKNPKDKTMAKGVNKTVAKGVVDNKKKRKNKQGKTVGALTAMEITMYK
ncbi:hypothetical protein CRE_29499 [Caenorhabditis remanei]|uniref:Uncharacterized protein n=1 Tax=Caenorhabditis remanei TaxID=31234 RepID=E3LVC7_CAERE|nr:hypothetical protein CRE_29499 [Caenorhabditis remanei]